MRGPIDSLGSPHPLGLTLPGIYQSDPLAQRLCASLDDVLAPVLSTLDNISAYLDVSTAPADFLPWLGRWLGMPGDGGQWPERQRELLRSMSELQGWQGTKGGIEAAVEALVGVHTEAIESGGSASSMDPGAPLPGEPTPAVVVRVFPNVGQEVDEVRLRAIVRAIKPAHVVDRVQVVRAEADD
jgi:phage tail-like protein